MEKDIHHIKACPSHVELRRNNCLISVSILIIHNSIIVSFIETIHYSSIHLLKIEKYGKSLEQCLRYTAIEL